MALPSVSQRQIAEVCERFSDHEQWCAESIQIRDKFGFSVPLRLTPSQIKLNRVVRRQQALGIPVRVAVLKARQVHFSVGVASIIFHDVAFFSGQRAMVVAHQHKASRQIWGYYDQFCASYNPEFSGARRLDIVAKQKDKYIEFAGGGFIDVQSAESPQAARSSSLRYLHLSEHGFWRDAATLRTGLMQNVPDDPGTVIIDESTANGVGGSFWQTCMRTMDPAEAGDWVFVFFGWHEHPEYVRPLNCSKAVFQDSMVDEERQLYERHGLRLEQINWRRWAIRNKCEGSIDRFHQEYPSTPEEAFIVSGRPRFSTVDLGAMPIVREPLAGRLEQLDVGMEKRIIFTPHERGELRIWQNPVPGREYVIGADTSEGLDPSQDIGSGDPDYSVASVCDRDTGDQVAVLRERLQPAEFGRCLCILAAWYNWAFLVPEINNTGIATMEEILRQQYPLERIYQRKRNPDDRRPATLPELGWRTTTVTRPQLVHYLDRAIRERSIHIRDPISQMECSTFVLKPSGKAEAQQGCHDDTVIALALCVIGITAAPRQLRVSRAHEDGRGQPKPEQKARRYKSRIGPAHVVR